jgi:hypothetical protein
MDIVLKFFKDYCLRHWSIESFILENGFYNEIKYGSAFAIHVSSLKSFWFSFCDFGIENIFTISKYNNEPNKDQRMQPISFGMKSNWGIDNVEVLNEKIKGNIFNSTVLLYSVNIFLRSYYKIALETFHLQGDDLLVPTSITDILVGIVYNY